MKWLLWLLLGALNGYILVVTAQRPDPCSLLTTSSQCYNESTDGLQCLFAHDTIRCLEYTGSGNCDESSSSQSYCTQATQCKWTNVSTCVARSLFNESWWDQCRIFHAPQQCLNQSIGHCQWWPDGAGCVPRFSRYCSTVSNSVFCDESPGCQWTSSDTCAAAGAGGALCFEYPGVNCDADVLEGQCMQDPLHPAGCTSKPYNTGDPDVDGISAFCRRDYHSDPTVLCLNESVTPCNASCGYYRGDNRTLCQPPTNPSTYGCDIHISYTESISIDPPITVEDSAPVDPVPSFPGGLSQSTTNDAVSVSMILLVAVSVFAVPLAGLIAAQGEVSTKLS